MLFPIGTHPVVQEDLLSICAANLPWGKFLNKSILITGANGFLPSYLCKALLVANRIHNLNLRIYCVTRGNPSKNHRLYNWGSDKDLGNFTQDISLPLEKNFPKADFIIHAASQASPKFYGIDPIGTLTSNSIGTANLLNHAKECSSEKFLFFSSGEIYGEPINPDNPISETDYGYLDPLNLRSCYAESKRMGENMCVSWSTQLNINISIVRPFHTYGPGMSLDDGRVFADFVRDIVNKNNITLTSSGTSVRAFCYLKDATIGFLTVLLNGQNREAYNIGNPDAAISMKNLAEKLASLFQDQQIQVQMRANPTTANQAISKAIPCIKKAQAISWTPTTSIEEGFKRTVHSFL